MGLADLRQHWSEELLHVAVFNWARQPAVEIAVGDFLKPGDRYRPMDPRDFYGKPVLSGTYQGKPIRVPAQGEFAASVLLK